MLLEKVEEEPVMGCDVGYDNNNYNYHQGDYSKEEFIF